MTTVVILLILAGLYLALVLYLILDVFTQSSKEPRTPNEKSSSETPKGPERGDTKKAA